jgi:hypothetical protein
MVTRAAVMHIAERALNRVGAGAVGRQQEQRHPRVSGQPLLHGLRLVDIVVIDDPREPGIPLAWIALIEDSEQLPEQHMGVAWPQAVVQHPGSQIQNPCEVVLLVLAGNHDLQLGPFGHPGRAPL